MIQIGFVGDCDCYDIVLYLSRILCRLGKAVLLVDVSPTRGLYCTLPQPGELKKDMIAEYRGVYWSPELIGREMERSNYDVIIGHYGTSWYGIEDCDQIVYVTDQRKQAVRHLIQRPSSISAAEEWLLIRDIIPCGIEPRYIKEMTQITTDRIYALSYDEVDVKKRIRNQYEERTNFRCISKALQELLKDVIMQLCPDIDDKSYRKAYREAKGGK